MRETGWSLSTVSDEYLREVDSSKQNLLLSEVIRIENSANNGEILPFNYYNRSCDNLLEDQEMLR